MPQNRIQMLDSSQNTYNLPLCLKDDLLLRFPKMLKFSNRFSASHTTARSYLRREHVERQREQRTHRPSK